MEPNLPGANGLHAFHRPDHLAEATVLIANVVLWTTAANWLAQAAMGWLIYGL